MALYNVHLTLFCRQVFFCVIDRSKSHVSSQLLRRMNEGSRSERKPEAGLSHYSMVSLLSSILTCDYVLHSFILSETEKKISLCVLFLSIKLYLNVYTYRQRRSNWHNHHRKHEYLKYTNVYFYAIHIIIQFRKSY